jgi:DNA-binding transcriptional MerR regulator
MNAEKYSIGGLADGVNGWCSQHQVEPLHNGTGLKVTIRNIRYYQSLGLVDRPVSADGLGFNEKHRLQLIAIRVLQAKGLPLGKIQSLLYARSEEDLLEVERQGWNELTSSAAQPLPGNTPDWRITPIGADLFVLARSGRDITPAQRLKIQEILSPGGLESPKVGEVETVESMGMESFRPETD